MKLPRVLLLLLLCPWSLAQDDFIHGLELELWQTHAGIQVEEDPDENAIFRQDYPENEIQPSLSAFIARWGVFFKATAALETDYSGSLLFGNRAFPITDRVTGETVTGSFEAALTSTLERNDLDLTLGYSWPFGLAVVGGYKEIRFSESFESLLGFVAITVPDDQGQPVTVVGDLDLDIAYRISYKGPFVGVAWSDYLRFGNLAYDISAAYADLDGDYWQSVGLSFLGTNTVDVDRFSTEADGFSWRVGISTDISDKLNLALGYKGQTYDRNSRSAGTDLDSSGVMLRLRYIF